MSGRHDHGILEAADEVLVHVVDSLQCCPVRVDALHLIAREHGRAATAAARVYRHLRKLLRVFGGYRLCNHAPVHHVRHVRRAAIARGLAVKECLELPQQLGAGGGQSTACCSSTSLRCQLVTPLGLPLHVGRRLPRGRVRDRKRNPQRCSRHLFRSSYDSGVLPAESHEERLAPPVVLDEKERRRRSEVGCCQGGEREGSEGSERAGPGEAPHAGLGHGCRRTLRPALCVSLRTVVL